jgi:K+ transporter
MTDDLKSMVDSFIAQVHSKPRVAGTAIYMNRMDVVPVALIGDNFHSIVAYYGFVQSPDVPRLLQRCGEHDPHFNMMDTHCSSAG